jgi:peptidoglycan/xylan/chitin deacetylase (PgdA/CDA1 family)
MNLILSVKKIAAVALYYSGAIRFLQALSDNSSLILAYHRILPKSSDDISFIQPGMYVTVETFEKHMAFISKHFNIMRLEDLKEDPKPKSACIVTFDDGWADNYTYAFPILKKYGIPATIFLSTNMIGSNNWPWPDRVTYYIHSIPLEDFLNMFGSILRKIGQEFPGSSFVSDKKGVISEQVINYMKTIDNRKIISLMDELDQIIFQQKKFLIRARPWLTWNEIMEMRNGGLSFGSHTHNHLILSRIPLHQAREEIMRSKELLSEKIGETVVMFSYPNGDYNVDLMRVVRESGYKIVVTTQRGFIDESDDLLTLRRVMIHNDITSTIPMLACVLTNKIPFF